MSPESSSPASLVRYDPYTYSAPCTNNYRKLVMTLGLLIANYCNQYSWGYKPYIPRYTISVLNIIPMHYRFGTI